MAVSSVQPDNEITAYMAYTRHIGDCLWCDPGEGVLCRRGAALHNRWTAAQEEQREDDR